ncbi:hypothetical protein QWI30_30875 [Citrobacter freundii]|nr:hypothetical protein [Citrobacter freundii]
MSYHSEATRHLSKKMNDVAKADYEKSSNVHSNEKLGVNYKTVCGPHTIDLSSADGWARINGAKPETQKISPIGLVVAPKGNRITSDGVDGCH